MTDQKEPSEEQRHFTRGILDCYSDEDAAHFIAARDAAQFRRGVEAAIAIVEREVANYDPWSPDFVTGKEAALARLRNLRGDDDG